MPDWQELTDTYFMRTGRRQPITLVRGEGVRVWDDQGKEYLDFVGGWASDSLGHCHPVLVKALTEQASQVWLVSNQFYNVPQAQLAESLVNLSGLTRVFFANSGAEANEGAIKLARKWGKLHRSGAYEIISAQDSFHGRTLATIAATGQSRYREPFTPMPDGFRYVEFNSVEAIMAATSEKTVGVLLEPVQGEGGVHVPSPDYLKQVRRWCDEQGLLLILDEIQTGMGRLGSMFGFQHYEVQPDVITLGKGLGGGFPVSAILATERASVFEPGDHGTTFGGNPLACAVALAVVNHMQENRLPERVRETGQHLKSLLQQAAKPFSFIKEVRGVGLLLAVEFTEEMSAAVVSKSNEAGLLLNAVKPNAIRLMPPLILTQREAEEAVSILKGVWQQIDRERRG